MGAGAGAVVVGTGAVTDDGAGGMVVGTGAIMGTGAGGGEDAGCSLDVAGATCGDEECVAAATDPPTTAAATTKMLAKRTRFRTVMLSCMCTPL